MDARKITDLLGGTWDGTHGMVPCAVLQPGPDPDPWRLSVCDFDGYVWFFLDRQSPGPGAQQFTGPWFRVSEGADGHEDDTLLTLGSLKAKLRDFITWMREAEEHYEGKRRHSEQALAIWNEAQPIAGTPAEAYLRQAGVPAWQPLPDSLRYHASCWHPSGAPRPALVALLTDDLQRVFPEHNLDAEEVPPFPKVHMTYLPPESSAEDPTGGPEEFLLGTPGSAVEIVKQPLEAKAPIVLVETIPSALTLASGILRLLPTPVRIWATLSAEGMKEVRLPVDTDPPMPGYGTVWRVQDPRWVIIASDGRDESRRAAWESAERARVFFRVDLLNAPEGQTWTEMWADMARKSGWADRGCVSWNLDVTARATFGRRQAAAPPVPSEREGAQAGQEPASDLTGLFSNGDDIPF